MQRLRRRRINKNCDGGASSKGNKNSLCKAINLLDTCKSKKRREGVDVESSSRLKVTSKIRKLDDLRLLI
jgi:hypothetical protein